jgi:hypothetical protein
MILLDHAAAVFPTEKNKCKLQCLKARSVFPLGNFFVDIPTRLSSVSKMLGEATHRPVIELAASPYSTTALTYATSLQIMDSLPLK